MSYAVKNLTQGVRELLLLFGEIEVHCVAPQIPRIICEMMFFWISFDPP